MNFDKINNDRILYDLCNNLGLEFKNEKIIHK